jgi:hypothetical protein
MVTPFHTPKKMTNIMHMAMLFQNDSNIWLTSLLTQNKLMDVILEDLENVTCMIRWTVNG